MPCRLPTLQHNMCVAYGMSRMVYGVWCMVYGVWCMVCGMMQGWWCKANGVRGMACGIWCMYRVWSMEYGMCCVLRCAVCCVVLCAVLCCVLRCAVGILLIDQIDTCVGRNDGAAGPWNFADNGRREKPTTPSWYSCIISPGSIFQIVNPSPCRPTRRAETPSFERSNVTVRCIMARIALH